MDGSVYYTQADTINVDDIAKNRTNRIILRRLQMNNADDTNNDILYIQNRHYEGGERCIDYAPEGANDMGWLGYFIGKNHNLQELHIEAFTPTSGASVGDVLEPFFRGICLNKSIQKIDFDGVDLMGGRVFTMMGSFFQNNHNLTKINIPNCDFGDEGGRLFALAIGSSTHKSLKDLCLRNNDISEEGMVDIITALSMHPHLQQLDLGNNCLRKNGCVALATLLLCPAKELQCLYLSSTEINDEGIEALVPALKNCNRLKNVYLSDNSPITTRGWQRLASILEAPNSNLERLHISGNNVVDEAVATFALALTKNSTLYELDIDINSSITTVGWEALSKLLCDTTSVNATFLSNHTLSYLGDEVFENEIIGPLLDLNARNDKKEVAIIKILQTHDHFDMQPFFEWEFKVLPLVVSWLERASACEVPGNFEPNIQQRKLSTIYQFVRDVPVLYVETRLRKELEDIKKEQQMLEERKMNIMRRLGRL